MTNRNMPVLDPSPAVLALPAFPAFLAFLALALSWSLGTPLLSAADEPEQTVKAAAVVRGEFAGPEHVWNFLGWQATYTTPDYVEVSYRLPHGLVTALAEHDPGCYAFRIDVTAACSARANARDAAAAGDIATTHMDYSPLYYLLVGWPSLLLDGDGAIYGMRIASAAITAVLLAAGYACAARRRRTAAIGVLAAATPAAIYFGSVVNPSGLEISSAVLVWTSFLAMVRRATDREDGDAECGGGAGARRDRLLFTVSGALLILTRPLGPVWLAMIVVLVLATRRKPIAWLRQAVRGRGARLTGAALACALLAAAAWDATQNTAGMVPKANPHYTLATGAYLTLQQTPNFLAQMLGLIGWNDVHVPAATTLLWYGAITALLLLAVALGDRRERLVILALAALIVLFPIVFEAYSAASYGSGWQGRYALPLAAGLPILGAEIVMRRLPTLSPDGDGALPRALAATLGAGLALAYLCQVWWTWRRYAQGLAGTTIPLPAKWSPPLGWPGVLALAASGCLGLLALQTRPRLGPGPVRGPALPTPAQELFDRQM